MSPDIISIMVLIIAILITILIVSSLFSLRHILKSRKELLQYNEFIHQFYGEDVPPNILRTQKQYVDRYNDATNSIIGRLFGFSPLT